MGYILLPHLLINRNTFKYSDETENSSLENATRK